MLHELLTTYSLIHPRLQAVSSISRRNLSWTLGIKRYTVVATTRQNSTCDMLTSAKLTEGYLVVEITRELDKEPLLY